MPILSIVAPNIPADRKDAFLAAWPTLKADLEAQPGVAGVSAGPVIAEDGSPVTEFKFVQNIAFKTAEDFESFSNSPWAKKQEEQYKDRAGGDAVVGTFEVADFPQDATRPAFTQFSTIVLHDAAKGDEARKVWSDLTAAVGKKTWGGRSTGDGPSVGLALIGWDSLEEAGEAYKKPEAEAAFTTYKTLGKTKNVMVQLQ
ncbi:hypothetical protein AK830_g6715 [Neonectria ditissima]|uniref:Stress-response A/B barrel domain-containing protein n=1 Tax=Neonectria ditissima TaxID=78410 RepID=A0A0P7BFR6_9HYPO|nr:hypothetical protein AK830_g6715 [Neonectria ditissima]